MPEAHPCTAANPEEMRTLSDQEMVFLSKEPSSLKETTKTSKSKLKASKAKFKVRRSTPAPPTKGDGRKRFVHSPLPEDKQLRKKLSFGTNDSPPNASPKCKGAIFPVNANSDGGDASQQVKKEKEAIGFEHESGLGVPESTPEAAMEKNTDPLIAADFADGKISDVEEDEPPYHSSPCSPNSRPRTVNASDVSITSDSVKVSVPEKAMEPPLHVKSDMVPYLGSGSRDVLAGDLSVPEKAMEPPLLLKSDMVPYLGSGSRDVLAGDFPRQPKKDNLLHLTSLDAPDMMDSMMAQPLLAGGQPELGGSTEGAWTMWPSTSNSPSPIQTHPHAPSLEDFPPLERGRAMRIRDSFESGSTHPKENGGWAGKQASVKRVVDTAAQVGPQKAPFVSNNVTPPRTQSDPGGTSPHVTDKSGVADERNKVPTNPTTDASGNPNKGSSGQPRSMADLLRDQPSTEGPQAFEPEKIRNIGYATTSNGIPAIYFSGLETENLAKNLGHAIVGKFSHSIPASHQIQKSLDSIKFTRGYTWKYINAKHILVQFEDLADYARLLSGPKGTPVWLIDRHPMRVFKWSPDFDAYCESPIAAIWCNLIGLPLHLFDQSALYAIGKLLGTPIQVDRATINKTRLSFARICIEIDITKAPPEEIILDICGREVVQQVRWDKIPSYCQECKHVGHKSEMCYAAGRGVRPVKKNYHSAPQRQPHHETQGDKGKKGQTNQNQNTHDWKHQGKAKGSASNSAMVTSDREGEDDRWHGPDIMGELHPKQGGQAGNQSEKGSRYGREGNRHPSGSASGPLHQTTESIGAEKGSPSESRGTLASTRGGMHGSGRTTSGGSRGGRASRSLLSTNQYYSLMAEEGFDNDEHGEAEDMIMELQPNLEAVADPPPDPNAEIGYGSYMEAEPCQGGKESKIRQIQGGPSCPPGMNLSC